MTSPDPRIALGEQLLTAVARISYQLHAREPEDLAGLPARLLQAMKVQEEAGELAAALIGITGQNPRKGVTHTWDDAVKEAIDVAMSALVFVETIQPGQLGDILTERLAFLEERAATFGAPPLPIDQPTNRAERRGSKLRSERPGAYVRRTGRNTR